MDYGDASTKLAELIQSGHYDYPEQAGLAIQILHKAIDDGEDPLMALVMAKTLKNGLEIDL